MPEEIRVPLDLSDAIAMIERQKQEIERLTALAAERQEIIKEQLQQIASLEERLMAMVISAAKEISALKEEIWHLKGAMKADDERLVAASDKAGIPYVGCDTADHLADIILELKAKAKDTRLDGAPASKHHYPKGYKKVIGIDARPRGDR